MFRHRQSDGEKKRAAEGGRLSPSAGPGAPGVPGGERHDGAGVPGLGSLNAETLFRFDPTALVRGIVYHLTDENIADDVSRDSVRRTIERLVGGNICPAIDRGRWAEMSNRERLQWLLAESRTTHSLLFGRTAVLLPAGHS